MSFPKHFKFSINGIKGVEFSLPSKFYVPANSYYGEHINANRVAAVKLIKQFVKAKAPNVVCSATSESFSGGNSITVYLSDKMGNPVSDELYKEVYKFANLFKIGSFNGMIDMYEINRVNFATTDGKVVRPGVWYVHVENRAAYGSVPYLIGCVKRKLDEGKELSEALFKVYNDNAYDNGIDSKMKRVEKVFS